jgi:hypothetical protein
MFRQFIFVSLCSWVGAGTIDKDQQSLIQAALDAGGEISIKEILEVDVDSELDELSQMSVNHHLEDDVFHLFLHHKDGITMFQMHEHHVFGEGIHEYGENETVKIIPPDFRTFKTVDGDHGRVQLSKNGQLHGWLTLYDQLIQVEKNHHADNEASIHYLRHRQGSMERRSEGVGSDVESVLESNTGCHEVEDDVNDDDDDDDGDGLHKVCIDQGCYVGHDKECVRSNHEGDNRPGNNGLFSDDNKANPDSKKLSLLDTESRWAGTKWYPGCYNDDSTPHVMKVGVCIDNTAKGGDSWNQRRGYSYNGGSYQSEIAYQFNQATMIYQNQMNIELQVGFTITYANDAAAPNLFDSNCAVGASINNQLNQLKDFVSGGLGGKANPNDVVSTHMFTGCNPSGYGTVGLAWVGTLCNGGYATGVNHMNSGWTTFAHELGHNFKASHSFEAGQGRTGGIMDYGDGKLDGIYQFNTQYRKSQVCGHVNSVQSRCSSAAFYAAGNGGSSPRRRAPTPPRRRSSNPPRRRVNGGGGDCKDKSPTGIKIGGKEASCGELKRYCSGYSFVRSSCCATCSGGSSPTPSPTRRRAAAPPRRRRASSGGCSDKQSSSNCQRWKQAGYCASSHKYGNYMKTNCCATCGAASPTPPPTPPPTPTPSGGGGGGGCVQAGSIPNDCSVCREREQCQSGGFCCPYMKKCVKSSSQGCYRPIANCRSGSCSPTDGSNYADWGKPTC